MNDLSRPERLQIMLSGEELSALDDWRFAKRMPSRAAAIRELLRRGLVADGFDLAQTGQRSASFGILDPTPPKPNDHSSKGRGSGRRDGAV
jgi:hypothetical protein